VRRSGLMREDAAHRAVAHALNGVTSRFNAAEFDSVRDTKFPGFHIANVTLQPRQIQQHTSMEICLRGTSAGGYHEVNQVP
jgi:hypothetical protein